MSQDYVAQTLYVAILKGRLGELQSLREVDKLAAPGLLPLLEMPGPAEGDDAEPDDNASTLAVTKFASASVEQHEVAA